MHIFFSFFYAIFRWYFNLLSLKKYFKETGRVPIIATMADESRSRRSAWMRQGCNAFSKKSPSSQPMSFWTENDVLEFLHTYNIPYASVYGEIIPCGGGGQRQVKEELVVSFAHLALIWRSLQTVFSGSNSLIQSCGSIA